MSDPDLSERESFRVSVVIPTYNMADLVSRAIRSAHGQSYRPEEIIVVDDGSTDNIQEVVAGLGEEIPELRLIRQQNKGNAGAKNTGIREAAGNWVAFLDADDAWLPNRLQSQCQLLQQHPELNWMVGGYYVAVEQDGDHRPKESLRISDEVRRGGTGVYDGLSLLTGGTSVWVCTAAVRKSVLDEMDGFHEPLRGSDDLDLWIRLSLAHPRVGFIAEAVALYTVGQTRSISGNSLRRIDPSRYEQLARLQAWAEQPAHAGRSAQLRLFLRQLIERYMRNLVRSGATDTARQYAAELRRRQLPVPSLGPRLLSQVPRPLAQAARLPLMWAKRRVVVEQTQ